MNETHLKKAEQNPCWRHAMLADMDAIEGNGTWLPIGLMWIFKVKRDVGGNIMKHKVGLVVKGYAQRRGSVSPITLLDSVRLLIALAVHQGWEVHHLDVKSTFLNRPPGGGVCPVAGRFCHHRQ
jgi:hypothetical protein